MLDLDHLSADHLNDFYGSMQGFFVVPKILMFMVVAATETSPIRKGCPWIHENDVEDDTLLSVNVNCSTALYRIGNCNCGVSFGR